MDTTTWILLGLIIGPTILVLIAVVALRSRLVGKGSTAPQYRLTFLRYSAALSRHQLLALGVALLVYGLLSSVSLVLALPITLFALLSLNVLEIHRLGPDATTSPGETLLHRLGAIQNDMIEVDQQMEQLGLHLRLQQAELDVKDKLRVTLEREIEKKSKEAALWSSLTEDQRRAVTDATAAAVSKAGRGTFWSGLIVGFFLNLLATLSWTLLGNPGRDQVISYLIHVANQLRGIP